MSDDPSQSLLRWGIEHAEPGALIPLAEDMKAGRRPDLNTDVLRAIMGTTDADRMRDCVQVIEGTWVNRDQQGNVTNQGSSVTHEDKLRAWDDLEMLVEDIDNANGEPQRTTDEARASLDHRLTNVADYFLIMYVTQPDLKNLGLWPRITKHLTSDDDQVLMRACWVCGTAVQNNPRANAAFLEHDPLPTINSLLMSDSSSTSTRNKAMYCLSSTLKHSPLAVARFGQLDGWSVLRKCLQDPSSIVRNKTAFLLSQLVSQVEDVNSFLSTLRTNQVLSTLIESLSSTSAVPTGPNGEQESIDLDYKDKSLRFFVNAIEAVKHSLSSSTTSTTTTTTTTTTIFDPEEKQAIRQLVQEVENDEDWSVDDLGLAQSEWQQFKQAI
ncbi:hsp70 nucleotide exchange factor fes1 [Microbotryomycetes sp. JL221]|nr:hsp70 nucleotide exchange factor fes1 [Microbotryomycetes sp. JL221]